MARSTITVWQDTGSSHARVAVQFDPTFDEFCALLDNEEAVRMGIDLDGFDEFGVYHPEYAPASADAMHILQPDRREIEALRFRAMGG